MPGRGATLSIESLGHPWYRTFHKCCHNLRIKHGPCDSTGQGLLDAHAWFLQPSPTAATRLVLGPPPPPARKRLNLGPGHLRDLSTDVFVDPNMGLRDASAASS